MKGVSIVICCFNSSKRLFETLKHIAELDIDNILLELIIVDNASVDNTVLFAQEVWNKLNPSEKNIAFKIVKEYQAGLTSARKKGVKEAKFEYILFVDDDNWLQRDFINESVNIMEHSLKTAVVGGLGTPFFENGIKPAWFDDNCGNYAVGEQAVKEGIITFSKGFVFGASSFWRAVVLKEIFTKPLILADRMGGKLSSGGDSELCYNAILLGYDIEYSSRLKFTHFIPESRISEEYLIRLKSDSIQSNLLLHGYLYKTIHKEMFNSYFKRKWWGQILIGLFNMVFRRKRVNNNSLKAFVELAKLNNKYDKLFL